MRKNIKFQKKKKKIFSNVVKYEILKRKTSIIYRFHDIPTNYFTNNTIKISNKTNELKY